MHINILNIVRKRSHRLYVIWRLLRGPYMANKCVKCGGLLIKGAETCVTCGKPVTIPNATPISASKPPVGISDPHIRFVTAPRGKRHRSSSPSKST